MNARDEAQALVNKWAKDKEEHRLYQFTLLIDAITAALEAKDRRIERLEGYLERANWRRCDIPACNCNGYHNWNPTREEIEEPLRDQLTAKDAEITALMEKGVAKDFEIHSKDAEIERLKEIERLHNALMRRRSMNPSMDGNHVCETELLSVKDQLAEAKEILKPFAEMANQVDARNTGQWRKEDHHRIQSLVDSMDAAGLTVGHCRAAAAFLQNSEAAK